MPPGYDFLMKEKVAKTGLWLRQCWLIVSHHFLLSGLEDGLNDYVFLLSILLKWERLASAGYTWGPHILWVPVCEVRWLQRMRCICRSIRHGDSPRFTTPQDVHLGEVCRFSSQTRRVLYNRNKWSVLKWWVVEDETHQLHDTGMEVAK